MTSIVLNGQNDTDIIHWQPNPVTRGTAGILSSCLITIILCVWSALHLNVPTKEGVASRFRTKVKWMLLGLVAPELIVYTAWNQRYHAKKLRDHMNRRLGVTRPTTWRNLVTLIRCTCSKISYICINRKSNEAPISLTSIDEEKSKRTGVQDNGQYYWTLKHGFFGVMGGFGLHIPPLTANHRFFPDDRDEYYSITYEGIRFLADIPQALDEIPKISESDIIALGRASSIAKCIVCAQAFWFCLQCVARLSQGYPISLLELNTFAHAVCVLLSYMFWWEKPFDVEQPVYFQSRFLHPQAARMFLETYRQSSFAHVWREEARSCLSQSNVAQLTKYFVGPARDLNVLDFKVDRKYDSESFVKFCMQTDHELPSGEQASEFREIQWQNPIGATGCLFRTTISLDMLRSNEWYTYWIFGWLDPLLELVSFGFCVWLALRDFLMDGTSSHLDRSRLLGLYVHVWGETTDISQIKSWHWKAAVRPNSSLPPPVLDFANPKSTTSGTVVIKECDFVLLNTAWQDLALKAPRLITSNHVSNEALYTGLNKGSPGREGLVSFFCMVLSTFVYGGIHLVGWNGTFKTDSERLVWRCSSIGIALGIIFLVVIAEVIDPLHTCLRNAFKRPETRDVSRDVFGSVCHHTLEFYLWLCRRFVGFLVAALIIGFFGLVLAYCSARLYLVGESFFNLFHLSAAVYQMPYWSAYFPHIS